MGFQLHARVTQLVRGKYNHRPKAFYKHSMNCQSDGENECNILSSAALHNSAGKNNNDL